MMQMDPKYKNYSSKMLKIVVWIIPTITIVLEAITYAIVFGYEISINIVVPIFLGILFVIFRELFT